MNFVEIKPIGHTAFLLPGALLGQIPALLAEIKRISECSPFRKMTIRSGQMSVAMTNCGEIGWIADKQGYRYSPIDPLTQNPWPPMADWVAALAKEAAAQVGFDGFSPNVCLINQYQAGARLGIHVDKDEGDSTQPIVSFSLGAPAVFRWGGLKSADPIESILLKQGDIVVWGGQDRFRYHGISKVYCPDMESGMQERFVMTFRYSKRWQVN